MSVWLFQSFSNKQFSLFILNHNMYIQCYVLYYPWQSVINRVHVFRREIAHTSTTTTFPALGIRAVQQVYDITPQEVQLGVLLWVEVKQCMCMMRPLMINNNRQSSLQLWLSDRTTDTTEQLLACNPFLMWITLCFWINDRGSKHALLTFGTHFKAHY